MRHKIPSGPMVADENSSLIETAQGSNLTPQPELQILLVEPHNQNF